jgi:SAM-dependent methyltransferase
LYRREPAQPAPFYEFLARDTVEQLRPFSANLKGRVIDIGGGPGYLADAVRDEGGSCVVVDYRAEELRLHGRAPLTAIVGDGRRLPIRDKVADVVHCSNVLEHVAGPAGVLSEMVRVLRPGGTGYVAFTPWLSPWGGHETSPWHYLGGERAAQRYERRTGRVPKNHFGVNLFRLRIATIRSWFLDQGEVEVLWRGPRYWPPAWRVLGRAGVAGEVLSWNHLVIFRRPLVPR